MWLIVCHTGPRQKLGRGLGMGCTYTLTASIVRLISGFSTAPVALGHRVQYSTSSTEAASESILSTTCRKKANIVPCTEFAIALRCEGRLKKAKEQI